MALSITVILCLIFMQGKTHLIIKILVFKSNAWLLCTCRTFNPNWHEGGHPLFILDQILSAEFLSKIPNFVSGEN